MRHEIEEAALGGCLIRLGEMVKIWLVPERSVVEVSSGIKIFDKAAINFITNAMKVVYIRFYSYFDLCPDVCAGRVSGTKDDFAFGGFPD
jgi:hypothetical protein